MNQQPAPPKDKDEETYHHEDTKVVLSNGAIRRVRKDVPDENDHEAKQRVGYPELGGSD